MIGMLGIIGLGFADKADGDVVIPILILSLLEIVCETAIISTILGA